MIETQTWLSPEAGAVTPVLAKPTLSGAAVESEANSGAKKGEGQGPFSLPPTSSFWGLEWAQVTMEQTLDVLDEIIGQRIPSHIITANLNYLMLCQSRPDVVALTKRARLVLCDGMPVWLRSQWSARPLPERVAGSDLIYRLSERAAEKGHRIFLLGAAEGVAATAAERLETLYPGLQIAGVECPPFGAWSEQYREGLLQKIRESRTDVLLVAFGQPKGELWIDEHLSELQVPVCIQLGASFDFVAGTAKRAPRWLQGTGLEWFYRMCHDPKRLLPRYLGNARCLARWLIHDMIGR